MIDNKQFSSLNKPDIYQLYVKTYKKLEEKEKFIEDKITKFTKMMASGLYMANPQLVGFETVQGWIPIAKEHRTVGTMTEANELVRYFRKKELSPECENLVIGSSKIGKLEIDKFFPINCAIHAFQGLLSTKKSLNKYDPEKIRTLVIQEGSNNVLKNNSKSAYEKFPEHKKLVDSCIEKLNPDVCVVCEIQPLSSIRIKMKKLMKSIILQHRTIPISQTSGHLFLMLILKM